MSTEDTGAPNLDAMPRGELTSWAIHCGESIGSAAVGMFPDIHADLAVPATRLLTVYAHTKAVAMKLREDGVIQDAVALEACCDWIYRRLPSFARW